MRINQDFILRRVPDEYLLIPVGQAALRIKGMIGLSESGFLIYRALQEGRTKEHAIAELMETYGIDEDTVREDTARFLEKLREMGVILEA